MQECLLVCASWYIFRYIDVHERRQSSSAPQRIPSHVYITAAKSETRACHQVAAQQIASTDALFEAQCPLDNTELCA